jgi:hypothetical protein
MPNNDGILTQDDTTSAYIAGYFEARQRCQWTITSAIDESNRLRLALDEALAHVDASTKIKILGILRRSAT